MIELRCGMANPAYIKRTSISCDTRTKIKPELISAGYINNGASHQLQPLIVKLPLRADKRGNPLAHLRMRSCLGDGSCLINL